MHPVLVPEGSVADIALKAVRKLGYSAGITSADQIILLNTKSVHDAVSDLIQTEVASPFFAKTVADRRFDNSRAGHFDPYSIAGFPVAQKIAEGGASFVYLVSYANGKGPMPAVLKVVGGESADDWVKRTDQEMKILKKLEQISSLEGFIPHVLQEGELILQEEKKEEGEEKVEEEAEAEAEEEDACVDEKTEKEEKKDKEKNNVRPFYVMNHINGHTLAHLLVEAQGKPPPAEFVDTVALQLAETLNVLHTEALINHRDVKPGNIMIDHQGRAVLADFGNAGSLDLSITRLTLPGRRAGGTRGYIADPLHAENDDQLPERDIYALGMVLYELYCGSLLQNLYKSGYALRPSPRIFKNPKRGELLLRMTDLVPANRPSAAEVAAFFRELLQTEERRPLLRFPQRELPADSYEPVYPMPMDQYSALMQSYMGEPAVDEGAALLQTIETFNADEALEKAKAEQLERERLEAEARKAEADLQQQRLKQRRLFMLGGLGTLATAAAASIPVFNYLTREEIANIPRDNDPPQPPKPRPNVPLHEGGQFFIAPAEDGIGGDITLFGGQERELLLPAAKGVHAYQEGKWIGSVHFPDADAFRKTFDLSPEQIQQMRLYQPICSYFSLNAEKPEAMTVIPGLAVFFRSATGEVTCFRISDEFAIVELPFEWKGGFRDTYIRPETSEFYAHYAFAADLSSKEGASFIVPPDPTIPANIPRPTSQQLVDMWRDDMISNQGRIKKPSSQVSHRSLQKGADSMANSSVKIAE